MEVDIFDPAGSMGEVHPHAPRLAGMQGRNIGILSNEAWQAHRLLPFLKGELEKRFPDSRFEIFTSGDRHIQQDEMIGRLVDAGCEGVILGIAAGGDPAVECGRAAAKLEQHGIPAVVIASHPFIGVVRNNVAGLGLAPDIASVTFPVEQFMLESDMMPLAKSIDDFVVALTAWQPQSAPGAGKEGTASRIRVSGATHSELCRNLNALFLRKQWGDGLSVTPPTDELVDWILQGTDLPRNTVLGHLLPKGGVASVEMVAVALAMAGGRPEYLPVLIAAVQAIFDPAILHDKWQTTSCSTFPAMIVNGPVARQIGINSGFGLLGPDPAHPAGGSIGRAVRLLQQNLGGAVPGVGTMSVFGQMRYVNAVFAEDEAALPPGWKPFNADHLGFAAGSNTVSVAVVSGSTNILRRGRASESLEDEAVNGLYRVATYMKAHNANSVEAYVTGTPGLLILTPTVVRQMAEQGWTREKIRQRLWEASAIPLRELDRTGVISWIREYGMEHTLKDPWPITSRPENIAILVAGGTHTTHAHWMQTAFAPKVVGREVALPARWGQLLDQARQELGPTQSA